MLFSRYAFLTVVASLLAKTDAVPAKDVDGHIHELQALIDTSHSVKSAGSNKTVKAQFSGGDFCTETLSIPQLNDVYDWWYGRSDKYGARGYIHQISGIKLYQKWDDWHDGSDWNVLMKHCYQGQGPYQTCCSVHGDYPEDKGKECCLTHQICVDSAIVSDAILSSHSNQCLTVPDQMLKDWGYIPSPPPSPPPPPAPPSTCASCNGKCQCTSHAEGCPCTPKCVNVAYDTICYDGKGPYAQTCNTNTTKQC
jgi:hypothetical protein